MGWYHYGARFYDPAIGRFPSVDPIIEKFPHVTPYNYAESSPVSNIDLWGLQKYHFTRLKEKDGSTYLRLNGVSDILKTEHYIDTRLGILGLWKVRTTVDNTRQEYEVSQTDNSYGISVTKTKAYNTLEDAAKAPDSDFKVSSVEKFMNGFEQNAELGLTVLYRGGGLFNIRNIDVAINKENGLVKITKGVSLNSDPKKVAQFGGAYKIESIPEELQIIQRGGPCHFEIVPKSEISLERFQELLNQVKTKKIE